MYVANLLTLISFLSAPADLVNNFLNSSQPNITGFLQSPLSKYNTVLNSLSCSASISDIKSPVYLSIFTRNENFA